MARTLTFIERMCEVAPDGFLCVDRTGRIVLANELACDLFGFPKEEMIGREVDSLVPERVQAEHKQWREEYMARPTVRRMGECRTLIGIRKDGSAIPVEIGLSPFPTREGIQVICHIRDVREEKAAREAMELAEGRFRRLCDANIIGIAVLRLGGGLEFVNPYLARLLGYESTNPKDYPTTFHPMVPEEQRALVAEKIKQMAASHFVAPWRMEAVNRRGERVPVMVGMTREHNDPSRILGFVLDMSEAHWYEEALRESERRQGDQTRQLQTILDALPANIAVLDAAGTIISVNQAWREFADQNGFTPGGRYGIGDNYMKAFCPARQARKGDENIEVLLANDGMKALQSGEISQFSQDYACHGPDEKRWFTMLGARLGTGADAGMVVMHVNITDKKLVQEELNRNALYDSLTGLPNRQFFLSRLDHSIQRAERNENYHYAVLFMDLDRFKNVNDGLGHHIGDLLLREVADRLRKAVRGVDTVARLGGDEFVVLLDDLAKGDVARIVAERIQRGITRAYDLQGNVVHIGASIGIAHASPQQNSATVLLRNADAAMYAAKEHGRGRIAQFDERLHQQAMRRLKIEGDLALAIERGEFHLNYQPIMDVKSGRVCAFEALMRWNHPEQGLISPMDFIPVAEDTGLIIGMGHWMIRECCRQRREWIARDAAFGGIKLNVNLSPKQFLDPALPNEILGACRANGCHPSELGLEITEGVVMENFSAATNVLAQLRAVNSSIHLDDFGTGYSSLAYIHKFPVDGLKIDRSFVMRMHEDEGTRKIVKTIIGLAHDLDLTVTAEGVERSEHLEDLRSLGCDHAQGYLFSKPVPAEEAAGILQRSRS